MKHTWHGCAALLALAALALASPPAQANDRYLRSFHWSGYRWQVRFNPRPAPPGHNRWADSRRNVRVQRDGTLRLNIVRGRSVEIVGPPLGYGRYRWVVQSDVSAADMFRVAAFFVRGTGGEQDVEFCRWGDPFMATAGSWVTWKGRTRMAFALFAVPPTPPYTIEITWRRGSTRFAVHDATGAAVLDTTVASARGRRHIAPRISYWLYPGHGAYLNPYTEATVHPPLVVRSFRFKRVRA